MVEHRSPAPTSSDTVPVSRRETKLVRKKDTTLQLGQPGPFPLRVLVVDDDPDTVTSLGMLLRHWGHEVITAGDGPSALEAARRSCPDVVLLDIRLPGMDGYEVARQLRRQGFGQRLIALTGFGREVDRQRAWAAGFDYHLVKPYDLAELERLVATAAPRGKGS
jgi:CheY-like chemotaxis protein